MRRGRRESSRFDGAPPARHRLGGMGKAERGRIAEEKLGLVGRPSTPRSSTKIRAACSSASGQCAPWRANRARRGLVDRRRERLCLICAFQCLYALNTRRAAEENAGTIRWIRPALQKPASGEQAGMEMPGETDTKAATAPIAVEKLPWPTTLPEQIKAIAQLLAAQPTPVGVDAIAAHFTSRGRWRERLPTILETLQALGRAREARPGYWIGSGFD